MHTPTILLIPPIYVDSGSKGGHRNGAFCNYRDKRVHGEGLLGLNLMQTLCGESALLMNILRRVEARGGNDLAFTHGKVPLPDIKDDRIDNELK